MPFPLFHKLTLLKGTGGARGQKAPSPPSPPQRWMPGRSLLVSAMAKTLSDHLLYSLEELVPYDFEKFKFKLQNISPEKEQPRIPSSQLQRARPVRMAYLLRTYYGEPGAVQLTLQVLRGMNQNQLAEELLRATSSGRPPVVSACRRGPAPCSCRGKGPRVFRSRFHGPGTSLSLPLAFGV